MSQIKLDIIGFGYDDKTAYGIPTQDRIHTAIFGEVGSGKSETMKLLIAQNISRNEGFLLIDPHGMLARDVLELIPKDKWNKVIYISPASIRQTGRTVRINPLEYKTEDERYIVAMSFVNALHNLHKETWGDRLEAVLRNACNALVEIKGSTLRDLRMLVSDQKARSTYLSKITSKDTIHFWKNTFEKQYSREAGSSAYNKLDKILATPPVAAMLDTPTSSVDFAESLNSGKFVVVDLSSGASDDITSFVGSIILHMVYVEAKKRVDDNVVAAEQLTRPFYIYIDEAHLFSPFALREILNTMRKFNVKVTLATQTVNAYPKKVADELPALVRTIICFKCDAGTAHLFKNLLPLDTDDLVRLSLHRFAFYSQGVNPIVGVGMTRPIRANSTSDRDNNGNESSNNNNNNNRSSSWQALARFSAQIYGEAVSIKKYAPAARQLGEYPTILACEYCVLLLVKNEKEANDSIMTRDEIFEKLNSIFGVEKLLIFDSIESLVRERYLERRIEKRKGRPTQYIQRFDISKTARSVFFSTTAISRRAGSTLHLAAIFFVRRIMEKLFKHCIVDLGTTAEQMPDVLIFEPATYNDGKSNRLRFDLEKWSDEIFAIEVEVDPTRHPKQVITNYTKNFEKGFDVWFIVFSEKHKCFIQKTLNRAGIEEKSYQIILFNKEQIIESYKTVGETTTTNNPISTINEMELKVLSQLQQHASIITSERTYGQIHVSTYAALQALQNLE